MLQQAVHVQPERLLVGLSHKTQGLFQDRLWDGLGLLSIRQTLLMQTKTRTRMEIGIVAVLPVSTLRTPISWNSMQLQILTWIHLIQSDYLAKHGKDYRSQNGGNLEPSLSA